MHLVYILDVLVWNQTFWPPMFCITISVLKLNPLFIAFFVFHRMCKKMFRSKHYIIDWAWTRKKNTKPQETFLRHGLSELQSFTSVKMFSIFASFPNSPFPTCFYHTLHTLTSRSEKNTYATWTRNVHHHYFKITHRARHAEVCESRLQISFTFVCLVYSFFEEWL